MLVIIINSHYYALDFLLYSKNTLCIGLKSDYFLISLSNFHEGKREESADVLLVHLVLI
jgi:hypothetical protein